MLPISRSLPLWLVPVILSAFGSLTTANATTFYVSPQPVPQVPETQQFRTIAEATKKVQPGDVVRISSGTYRESVTIEASGTAQAPIRFETAPAATVIVTGADRLTNWQKETAPDGENVFSAAWPYRFITWSKTGTHPDDDFHKLIGRAEQVFADGYQLRQVLSRDKLSRGTFYADLDNKRLFIQTANNAANMNDVHVEAATRDSLWQVKGAYIETRGITFRYAANQAQQGMTRFEGQGDRIEECVFENANSSGATFVGTDQVVRDCTFRDNGQLGWGAASCHRLRMENCLTENNNVKGFSRGWEAGGDKMVLARDVVIDGCRFLRNRGSGLWFDIGNENCTVSHCLIADNEDAGIFYEISFGLHAHDNVIVGNGLSDSNGAWGANGGIVLSSSPGGVIERNLLIGNMQGFQFREQGRTTPRIDAAPNAPGEWVWNHDETISNNVLAYNANGGIGGWFDVRDERLWPLKLRKFGGKERPSYVNEADFARGFQAELDKGAPRDLSLEKLNIRMENNFYARDTGQPLFNWGTEWLRHEHYTNLDDVRRDLSLEQGSREAPFVFGDTTTRDFRVPAKAPELQMKAYPQGQVPGVQLGVLPVGTTTNP